MTTHIMIDLETMGTQPGSAIVAIGAVEFNINQGILSSLYIPCTLQSNVDIGLTIDAETVTWWMERDQAARAEIYSASRSIQYGLTSLAEYLAGLEPDIRQRLIWGNGSDFDNVLLDVAYRAADIDRPWEFWNNRCYRTLKKLYPHIKMNRTGTHHNAVNDAESQAQHLIDICNQTELFL